MAQSRLEKIGTIFTRVNGLLRAGAMKPIDKPIWYDLYEAFPPKLEPRFDRPVSKDLQIRNIFYEEDVTRAKFQKFVKQETVNLFDKKRETQTQQFIQIYQNLKNQGALDEERIFETAVEVLQEQRQQMKTDNQELIQDDLEKSGNEIDLTKAYTKSMEPKEPSGQPKMNADSKNKSSSNNSIGGIDIKNLFKD